MGWPEVACRIVMLLLLVMASGVFMTERWPWEKKGGE